MRLEEGANLDLHFMICHMRDGSRVCEKLDFQAKLALYFVFRKAVSQRNGLMRLRGANGDCANSKLNRSQMSLRI